MSPLLRAVLRSTFYNRLRRTVKKVKEEKKKRGSNSETAIGTSAGNATHAAFRGSGNRKRQ